VHRLPPFPAVFSGKHGRKLVSRSTRFRAHTLENLTAAAADFMRDAFCTPPVLVTHEVLKEIWEWLRTLVVNSGCANAIMGCKGQDDHGK